MSQLGKPRIRIRFGIWCCLTPWPFICGCGYTPTDAYREWQRIVKERAATAHPLADEEMA